MEDRQLVLKRIRALVDSLSGKAPLGFLSSKESLVAHLYASIGEEEESAKWYLLAAGHAEQRGQPLVALEYLEAACRELPRNTRVRRAKEKLEEAAQRKAK